MDWYGALIERLAAQPCAGYGTTDSPASEPSALAALALAGAARWDAATRVADWFASLQAADGSVGVRHTEARPCWPTSLAVLTWCAASETDTQRSHRTQVDRAVGWMIAQRGVLIPDDKKRGHDGTIEAWPWVDETHAWVEPTALHVLALKQVGLADHPRTRSAVAMLFDRQLPDGGFNYGNTTILGRQLRPHLQPTGLALLALASERDAGARVHKSLDSLHRELGPDTATASLCWSLLALAAFDAVPASAGDWLNRAYGRTMHRGASHHKLALLALAAHDDRQLLGGSSAAIPASNPWSWGAYRGNTQAQRTNDAGGT